MKTNVKVNVTARKDRYARLDKAMHAIRQGDDFEREKAIEYLVGRPDRGTIERILPLLQEKDTPTRMAVVEVIKKIGYADIEAVARLLEDDNEDIRVYACEIMASMKRPETIPYLIKVLNNGSENVKNMAVIALGEFNDDRAVQALLDMLQEDQWIVFSAICSLGKTKHAAAVEPLLQIFRHSDEEISLAACEVLMSFGDNDILDKMFNTLKGWSKKKRERYVEVIIQQGNENLFLRLKQRIGQDLFEHLLTYVAFDKANSIPIFRLMVHFRSKQTCDILLENLSKMEPDDPQYDEVLELFASLSQVWVEAIEQYLGKGDEYALAIVKACAQVKIRVSESLLLCSFRASSAPVRREIVRLADVLMEGEGYDLLREAVKDQDGHVKSYAVSAIGRMKIKRLLDDIVMLSRWGFMDVRIKALEALLSLDDRRAMLLLEGFVNDGSTEDKKAYLAVAKHISGDANFPFIQRLFAGNDDDIRKAAVTVIGSFIHDNRYADIFQNLLKADNIPHEVLKIIKEKRLTQFKSLLNKIFSDTTKGLWTRYYALLALGSFEDSSLFDLFVRGLDDENSLIKIGSLKALGDLKDKRIISHVMPFVDSKDEDLRSTAELVLTSLGDLE